MNFWKIQSDSPLLAIAPMADVTDAAFRQIIARYGKPDVLWTEFVSADGLCSAGRERLSVGLRYTEGERPIVAQLFGKNPETMREAAKLCTELGFDAIDLNMGCPEKNLCRSGSCSALIKTPELALSIIQAAKEGAGGLPVSVKTRLGYNQNCVEEWVQTLVKAEPAAIIMHGRTRKQMSKVPADWDAIALGAPIAHAAGIPYLGNGDVIDRVDALAKATKYGLDGVMIGRAVMGNPWLLSTALVWQQLTLGERTDVMLEHAFLYEELFGGVKPFLAMRRHFKAYIGGYRDIKQLRLDLMQVETASAAKAVVEAFYVRDPEARDSMLVDLPYAEERFFGDL